MSIFEKAHNGRISMNFLEESLNKTSRRLGLLCDCSGSRTRIAPIPNVSQYTSVYFCRSRSRYRTDVLTGRRFSPRPPQSQFLFGEPLDVAVHRHCVALPLLAVLLEVGTQFGSLCPIGCPSSVFIHFLAYGGDPRPRVRAIFPKLS